MIGLKQTNLKALWRNRLVRSVYIPKVWSSIPGTPEVGDQAAVVGSACDKAAKRKHLKYACMLNIEDRVSNKAFYRIRVSFKRNRRVPSHLLYFY